MRLVVFWIRNENKLKEKYIFFLFGSRSAFYLHFVLAVYNFSVLFWLCEFFGVLFCAFGWTKENKLSGDWTWFFGFQLNKSAFRQKSWGKNRQLLSTHFRLQAARIVGRSFLSFHFFPFNFLFVAVSCVSVQTEFDCNCVDRVDCVIAASASMHRPTIVVWINIVINLYVKSLMP